MRAKEADEELRWTERQGARRVQQAVRELVAKEPDADVHMWARERMGEVAREYGYRHQSGVTHAVTRVEEWARTDPEMAGKLAALKTQLSTFKI